MIPTEPIGSIPRRRSLIEAIEAAGDDAAPALDALYTDAVRDTVARFEDCVHGLGTTLAAPRTLGVA